VAFLGHTAYAIVTGVEEKLGGQPGAIDGLYRVSRDGSLSVVADIGAWSIAHPPQTHFDLDTGFLYAMQPYHDGFLITDGHHNRVLRVSLNGDIREVLTLENVVPTGLERSGHKVYLSEAGPVPHVPETGKALAFNVRTHQARPLASGARLAVDVEFGPKHTLYVLSQGVWEWPNIPANAGLPASPNTGKLFRVGRQGNVIPVVEGLDRPTSVEFIKDSAFIVTLTGKVIRVDNVSRHHKVRP
jgi:hypothetical protein